MTYQNKAFEMTREHWEKQKRKAIKERDVLRGPQIVPKASFYDDSHGHKPGESNWKGFGFDLHPQVAFIAGGLIIAFIVLTFIFRDQASIFFETLLNSIGDNFGRLYILAANFFIIVMVIFASSRFGSIKIGGPDALPEFSTFSWFAMLISAGMGIGLMFRSVAEPIFHYMDPSPIFGILPETPQGSQAASGVRFHAVKRNKFVIIPPR